jgi:hypothetical protein
MKYMQYDDADILWYALYASNGKAVKIKPYLEAASIEYFFPLYYRDIKVGDSDGYRRVLLPLLVNLIFAKSSKQVLDPVLKKAKLKLEISSDLYYRDMGDKRMITVPDSQMQNFIAIARNGPGNMIYLSSEDISVRKGTRVKITGGEFAGAEGLFMRIKGDKRLVVSVSNLFSVATPYIPAQFVQEIDNN